MKSYENTYWCVNAHYVELFGSKLRVDMTGNLRKKYAKPLNLDEKCQGFFFNQSYGIRYFLGGDCQDFSVSIFLLI